MTEFDGKAVVCWILRTNEYEDKQLTNHHRCMIVRLALRNKRSTVNIHFLLKLVSLVYWSMGKLRHS